MKTADELRTDGVRIISTNVALVRTVLTESKVPALLRSELADLTGLGPTALRAALLHMVNGDEVVMSKAGPRSHRYSLTSRTSHVVTPQVDARKFTPEMKGYDAMMKRMRDLCEQASGRA